MDDITSREAAKQFKWVGTRPIRPDGVPKVTGLAQYGADLAMPGMLVSRILRSPHAHACIRSIDTSKAAALPGVKAVVTSADFPEQNVGSYPQPDWLIDRAKLAGRFPPRVRAKELWRVAPEWLEQAQDDATLLAIRDQERAGLDIITDGEMRRESYSNRFATALDGIDIDNPGTALDRSGHPNPVPRVVGRIRRRHPVQVHDVKFLRANTDRMIKTTVPGAFTNGAAGAERLLQGRGRTRHGLRNGGQRRD